MFYAQMNWSSSTRSWRFLGAEWGVGGVVCWSEGKMGKGVFREVSGAIVTIWGVRGLTRYRTSTVSRVEGYQQWTRG
ncbi:hypothetical protein BJX68DRAFT_230097 [Aspergillus pseudodeflectus]|uniref:Uncharacterized protein n=1 Tax=Aspergillus pseudodeflectus TaxID=176178 RepID=A0ABR4KY69_9EURO